MQKALLRIRDSLKSAINTMQDHLLKMTAGSKRLNSTVSESSEKLMTINKTMDTMQNETEVQTKAIAKTSEEVSEISNSIGVLNRAIAQQADHISKSSSAIEEMVANIAAIRNIAEDVRATTDTLSKSSAEGQTTLKKLVEEIQKIQHQSGLLQNANKTIADITAQTNLLAMNAAIEAAHAGEAGRGFAVVAGEVRKLAELSGKESEAISQEIRKIEKGIAQISSVSTETVLSMDTIFNKIKSVDDSFGQLGNAVEEQSQGGSQILSALKIVQEMTSEVRQGSSAIQEKSGAIRKHMNTLEEISRNVTKHVGEVKNASEDITMFLKSAGFDSGK
jgi:methyl-accepting chemotaxis protein